jgi:hypothetical protein
MIAGSVRSHPEWDIEQFLPERVETHVTAVGQTGEDRHQLGSSGHPGCGENLVPARPAISKYLANRFGDLQSRDPGVDIHVSCFDFNSSLT